MNVEHRTPNIERRMNVFCLFKKRFREAIPSFVIRYSAVRCLIQATEAASLIIKKPCHFGVVPDKESGICEG